MVETIRLVDLTHPISPDMPVYPGTDPPVLLPGCSLEQAGFLEKKITFYSHTGTHIDAPAHMLKDHNTLDRLGIDHFYGSALLIKLDNFTGRTIEVPHLAPYREQIAKVEFLLLATGWSQYWGSEKYFLHYPVLSLEAAIWINGFSLKGLGLDTISADTLDSKEYPVHKTLLQENTIIIENLANLAALPGNQFTFSCFPLSFEDADGSPVRAVASF